MIPLLRSRLSIQFFLQFAIWGAWGPVLSIHLGDIGFTGGQIGKIYATAALATMVSPLIAGQIADRWFPTQWFLSLSYLVTGALFLVAAGVRDYDTLYWIALFTMLFYGPTLGLTNSLSFHHLRDARREFPAVRLWGAIGWIAAGWGLWLWRKYTGRSAVDCLNLAGVFAVLNGLYCMTLPHTPPQREARDKFALGKALAMLKDPSYAVFSLLAFVMLGFASFYYAFAGQFFPSVGVEEKFVSAVMTIGQIVEVAVLFLLPAVYARLGAERTIALGILAWALRFGIFAIGQPLGLVIAAQTLHGFCFSFVSAAAMIYVERICPPDIRGSAQSFLNFVTYGVGLFAGSWFGGIVADYAKRSGRMDWSLFWQVPAVGCLAVLAVFLLGFRARDVEPRRALGEDPPAQRSLA